MPRAFRNAPRRGPSHLCGIHICIAQKVTNLLRQRALTFERNPNRVWMEINLPNGYGRMRLFIRRAVIWQLKRDRFGESNGVRATFAGGIGEESLRALINLRNFVASAGTAWVGERKFRKVPLQRVSSGRGMAKAFWVIQSPINYPHPSTFPSGSTLFDIKLIPILHFLRF